MSLSRLFGAWTALAVLMIGNGIFRELVLRNAIGPVAAETLSVIIGCAIILVVTRYSFRPLAAQSMHGLVTTSALLVGLTVAFEFLFGHYLDHQSWSDLIANYAIWRGQLWPTVLAVIALTPFIWGRWFSAQATHAPR